MTTAQNETQKPASRLSRVKKGRVAGARRYCFYGEESCMDGNTHIPYQVRHLDGTSANDKGGTIKNLYMRFNKIDRPGLGHYQRDATVDCEFFTSSMNEEGRIVRNRIVDVVSTGEKTCLEIETASGAVIAATPEHNFAVGSGFLSAGNLRVGDVLYLHNNTPFKVDAPKVSKYHSEWLVKSHPHAPKKIVRDKARGYENEYKRLRASRAVVEADMNDMTLREYRQRLNDGYTSDMKFMDPEMQVHHINEDSKDDRLQNLAVLSGEDHSREHATERHNNLRFVVVDDEIVGIKDVGLRDTYDIKMSSPYNNYIANKIVVHNSGKTTLAAHMPSPIFIDIENGSAELDVARYVFEDETVVPKSFDEVMNAIADIAVNEHDYKTLAIDSLDRLEALIWAHVCKRDSGVKSELNKTGRQLISIESYGYGKGYNVALDAFRPLLVALQRLLDKRQMNIVFIGHAHVKTFKNPSGDDYDRYCLRAHPGIAGQTKEWVDVVGFCHFEEFAAKVEGSDKKAQVGFSTGVRMVEFERQAAFDAKSRIAMPRSIELVAEDPWAPIQKAIDAGQKLGPQDLIAMIRKELDRIGDDELSEKVRAACNGVVDAAKLNRFRLELQTRMPKEEATENNE